jgi:DNA-binding transcriptional regulator YhcF (GntR family)
VADDRLTIIKGKQKVINDKIAEFFQEMQNLGLSKSDIVQMVEIEGAKK